MAVGPLYPLRQVGHRCAAEHGCRLRFPFRPGFPVRLTGRDIPRGLLRLARDSPRHPGQDSQGIVCGRSRAVGPGLRLGTSTAPDRFPPGPSARRPRPVPEVASIGPGTRVPGRGKPQSRSGSREYHPDPGRDRAHGGLVHHRIVPSSRTPSPSRAGLSSRHLTPRASRGGHDSDRASAWVNQHPTMLSKISATLSSFQN
jgi:hypothetical protein